MRQELPLQDDKLFSFIAQSLICYIATNHEINNWFEQKSSAYKEKSEVSGCSREVDVKWMY